MNYAIKKRYVPASQRFDERPKLKTMRRDEFTLEEYRKLHTVGRRWIAEADKPSSVWYRTVHYNMIPDCLQYRDEASGNEESPLARHYACERPRGPRDCCAVCAGVKVNPASWSLPRASEIIWNASAQSPKQRNQRIESLPNITGKPAKSLYTSLIADLLNEANLRGGTQGVPRSTYCFRHTYATLRLQEGVDVYFLAEQMGTSVHMIEEHYGHVNTIKHADRVLQGMAGWELPHPEVDVTRAKASKAAETHDKSKRGQHRRAG